MDILQSEKVRNVLLTRKVNSFIVDNKNGDLSLRRWYTSWSSEEKLDSFWLSNPTKFYLNMENSAQVQNGISILNEYIGFESVVLYSQDMAD